MTVQELISGLSMFDPALPVVISDVDTEWLLNITDIVDEGEYITIGGSYSDLAKKVADDTE